MFDLIRITIIIIKLLLHNEKIFTDIFEEKKTSKLPAVLLYKLYRGIYCTVNSNVNREKRQIRYMVLGVKLF